MHMYKYCYMLSDIKLQRFWHQVPVLWLPVFKVLASSTSIWLPVTVVTHALE
jgi:hypothetical protein